MIDGKGGNDTLNYSDSTGGVGIDGVGLTLTSVETVNVRSVGAVAIDTTSFADITKVNVLKSGDVVDVTAADTTDVSVAGAADDITVVGGKDVTVTDSVAGNAITIGDAGGYAVGNITVTDAKQADGDITVDGGKDVTITATSNVDSGAITVCENEAAAGNVVVTQNLTSNGDNLQGGAVTVAGGATVNVTVIGTITADAEADDGNELAAGTIAVTGNGDTTAVTVTQNLVATDWSKAGDAAVKEQTAITFKGLAKDQSTTVGNLTFTASKVLTADQVAQAFANLTNADKQTASGPTANGFFTGTLITGVTSGSASGATVTFTGAAENNNNLAYSTTGTALSTPVYTAGKPKGDDATAEVAVTYGDVTVDDDAAAAIKTITLDGFGNATLGGAGSLDALEAVSLAKSVGDTEITTAQTALALTVNDITGSVTVTGAGVTDLTLTATGTESAFDLDAAGVTDLVVDAKVNLDLSGLASMEALENATIKGAGAVDLGDISGYVALDTFNASANTGGVVATIETDADNLTGSITEYIFSAGADDVTLASTAIDTKITLGAGDDVLTLAVGTTAAAKVLDGGTGTNTIAMVAADAQALSGDVAFEAKMTGFSKLSLVDSVDDQYAIDLANLDDISYVITAGTDDVAEVTTVSGFADAAASGTLSISVGGVVYSVAEVSSDDEVSSVDATMAALATAIGKDARVTSAVYAAATNTLTITANDGIALQVGELASTKALVADGAATAVTSNQLVLDNMANNGTVELTAAGMGAIVNMTDATGNADTLNVLTKDFAGFTNVGSVIANGVETINVTTTDTFTDVSGKVDIFGNAIADGIDDTNSAGKLYVSGDALTEVKVSGAGDLTLGAYAATLTKVDGSDMTGVLTFDAYLAGLVVNGGTAGDSLKATAAADDAQLFGGAGNDTLTVEAGADRVKLDGGAGKDTFVINGASTTGSTYAVIAGVDSGDTIILTGADSFKAAKVTLSAGATESTQAYLTQAIAALGSNDSGWFQYGGNTYIVKDVDADGNGNGNTFVDGQDVVVMITGLVDLSAASFNASSATLEIA